MDINNQNFRQYNMNSMMFHSPNSYNKVHSNWTKKELINPRTTIKLATLFSGIGAIEFALKRLKLSTNIVFASDNDKFVKQSYFENYKISEENWYDDVHDIKGN